MPNSHLGVAMAFASLGVLLITQTASLPTPAHAPYGPSLFPGIIGGLMIAFGAIGGIDALRSTQGQRTGAETSGKSNPAGARNLILFAAFLLAPVGFVMLVPLLGFLLTLPLIVGGLCYLASGRLVSSVMLGVVLTIILHVIFYQIMRVSLPWGILEPFAGVLTWG